MKNMKFAIFGNIFQSQKSVYAQKLIELLKRMNAEVVIEKQYFEFLKNNGLAEVVADIQTFTIDNINADMVISIGGDGTFLQAASKVGSKEIPILGINVGRLGFLADISPDEMEDTFREIYDHNYTVEERSVLQLISDEQILQIEPYALNEIAVMKHDSSSMISIYTTINGAYLHTYQADGLILATPTGSTAYSLSVGGPIIVPHSETIAITPIAPHSLNVRPIVIRDDWEVALKIESRSHHFLVSVDGRSVSCKDGIQLTIRRAPHTVKVVKRYNHVFFNTLRQKMMWGADGRQ
jgi:NAD+ kinase